MRPVDGDMQKMAGFVIDQAEINEAGHLKTRPARGLPAKEVDLVGLPALLDAVSSGCFHWSRVDGHCDLMDHQKTNHQNRENKQQLPRPTFFAPALSSLTGN